MLNLLFIKNTDDGPGWPSFKVSLLVIILGLTLFFSKTGEAKTYYISPSNASDTNSGTTSGEPWKTFSHAMSRIAPGDTLMLMDGTFHQTLEISVSGEIELPVTIQALNDGMAIVDGQGVRQTLIIEGTINNYRHDIILRGFVCTNSVKSVYDVKYTRRLSMFRLSGSDAVNLDGNYHVFDFDKCEDILVEDCAAYGTGRIMFNYYSSLRGTFRRCWGRWKDNRHGSVKTALTCYGSGDCLVENCVMTAEPDVVQRVEGIKVNRRDGNPYGSRNKIYGNIVYGINKNGGTGFMTQGNEIIDDNEWINNASIGNARGCHQRNDRNLKVNRMTIAESNEKGYSLVPYCKTEPAYDCAWRVYSDIRNTSIVQTPEGISRNQSPIILPLGCTGDPCYGEMTHTWNNIYDAANPYSGTSKGTNETAINPQYDTNTYGKGAYLIVPPALKGKGENGSDIGAEILYRSLNGQLTTEPLWPWPMENRILTETSISVTYEGQGGIWKVLPEQFRQPNAPTRLEIE